MTLLNFHVYSIWIFFFPFFFISDEWNLSRGFSNLDIFLLKFLYHFSFFFEVKFHMRGNFTNNKYLLVRIWGHPKWVYGAGHIRRGRMARVSWQFQNLISNNRDTTLKSMIEKLWSSIILSSDGCKIGCCQINGVQG